MDASAKLWLRPNRFTRLLALAVVLAACWTGYWLGSYSFEAKRPNDGLVIDNAELVCGDVFERKDFRWQATVRNLSTRTIGINKFTASCGCVAVSPPSMKLAPGEKQAVAITIDLTRTSPEDARKIERGFAVRLIPEVDDGLAHLGWVFRGTVRTVFSTDRPADFSDDNIMGQPWPTRTVQLTAHVPVTIQAVECYPPLVDTQIALRGVSGGEAQFHLKLTPRGDLPVGRFTSDVRIFATDEKDEPLPPFSIEVTGRVVGNIHFVPEILVVGAKQVGDAAEETVVLQSRNATAFQVVRVQEPTQHVKVTALGKDQESVQRFRVSVVVSEGGNYSAAIRVWVRSVGRTVPDEIVLPFSYFGKAKH